MNDPIIYGLEACDTCRKARNWLKRFDIACRFVDYRDNPVDPAVLRAWATQLGGWANLVNHASTTWRTLPPARKTPGSDPEWILLIREYPALVKRPVIVTGDGAVHFGFSDNSFRKIFGRAG